MTVIEQLIPLADAHQKADEYISGIYWNGHKGCAVGCTIADAKKLGIIINGVSYEDHAALSRETRVPEMLWHLADYVFEGLPDSHRSAWTPRFLRACSQSKDLSNTPARIMSRLAKRLSEDALRDDVKAAALVVSKLWKRRSEGNEPTKQEWYAALEQADAAREQANAAREQADAAWEQFWKLCADIVIEECQR